MFRNFYTEQNTTDPRDSWYRPNLLYNIHYSPPDPPTPPNTVEVTREFDCSVSTCSEHSCEPHYRMETELVLSNKEVKKKEQFDQKMILMKKEAIAHVEYGGTDGDSFRKVPDKRYVERNCGDLYMAEEIFETTFVARRYRLDTKSLHEMSVGKQRRSSEIKMVNAGHGRIQRDICNVRQIGEVRGTMNDEVTEKETELRDYSWKKTDGMKMHDIAARNGVFDDYIETDESDDNLSAAGALDGEVISEDSEDMANDTTESGQISNNEVSLGGLPTDNTRERNTNEPEVIPPLIRLDAGSDDFGTAFGIMSVYCNSELHTEWEVLIQSPTVTDSESEVEV